MLDTLAEKFAEGAAHHRESYGDAPLSDEAIG
jgi:hypothetical protein